MVFCSGYRIQETSENQLCGPDVVSKLRHPASPATEPFISNDAGENKSNVTKDYAQTDLK